MELDKLDKVDTVSADKRGRVYLGPEFANDDVKLYIERVAADE